MPTTNLYSFSFVFFVEETIKGKVYQNPFLQYKAAEGFAVSIEMDIVVQYVDVQSLSTAFKYKERRAAFIKKDRGTRCFMQYLVDKAAASKSFPAHLSISSNGRKCRNKAGELRIEGTCNNDSCRRMDLRTKQLVKPPMKCTRFAAVFNVDELIGKYEEYQRTESDLQHTVSVSFRCEFPGKCCHRGYFGWYFYLYSFDWCYSIPSHSFI